MLVIENYGRSWRRDKIFWGRRGKHKLNGHLKGYAKGNRKTIVDFRDQIGIYVLFNANRDVVYVGQAGIGNKRLFGRLSDHRTDNLRDRWTHFSWFGLRGKNVYSDTLSGHHKPESWIFRRQRRQALHEIEAVLMAVVEPPMNRRGPNWTGTVEFLQLIDENVPKETDDMVRDILKRVKKIEEYVDELEE